MKEVVHEVVDLDSEEEDTVVVMGTDVSEGGSKYKKMETKLVNFIKRNAMVFLYYTILWIVLRNVIM